MFIQHNGLVIRNAEAKDAPQLCAWWNDGQVMAHAGFPNGLGTTAEKIAADVAADTDDTRRRLMLEYQGVPIGEACFRVTDRQTAEIGIKICDFSMQEKGLGKQLLSLLICALFERGFAKITLDTNLNNTRAQHVYERLGFRRIGVRYDSWRDQLGRLQSAVDYELTAEDFIDFAKET